MGAIRSIIEIIFILFFGQILGGVIGGLAQSMGIISFGPADPASLLFSLLGIFLVGIIVSKVS